MSPARPRAVNGHLVFEAPVPVDSVMKGDCVRILPGLAAESVDMVLTDPPYGCGYRDRQGRTVANDTCTDWIAPAFAEIFRLMKPDTLCISFYGWNAADAFIGAWRAAGFRLVGHIAFCKGYPSRERLLKGMHECAYVLAKGRPPLPVEPLVDVQGWVYTGNTYHPTQKPVFNLKLLIETYCREGGLVLDPFAGSGSTLVAAKECGRHYFGIELEEKYVRVARRRLAQTTGR